MTMKEKTMTEKTTVEFAAFVGIDWADRKHDVCLQAGTGGKREHRVLEHRPEAIDEWANGLRERFDNRPVAVCLEQRKGPLVFALSKYEHLVLFPVDPHLLAGLRRAAVRHTVAVCALTTVLLSPILTLGMRHYNLSLFSFQIEAAQSDAPQYATGRGYCRSAP